ncbi:MAG: DNA-directed RNA polymerase subunit alpha [Chloroflexota bacterium]
MKDLVLPKIECEAMARNYGRFVIVPLESGYGVTIGNALRRVLLSSIPGGAITSLRVIGVHHEFVDVPGAKQDMIELILNVKQIRLRCHVDDEVQLRLNARGKADILAGDIECPSDVEIVNPELPLLTMDSTDTELEIELVAERGRGYSPSEEREDLPIGQIPVDAVFSPITKVKTTVERTRVGQVADYDRLVIDIWTDGTIHPAEALSSAAEILVGHLSPVTELTLVEEVAEEEKEDHEAISSQIYETLIDDLDLTVRAYNCLKRQGITKVGEILDLLAKGEDELLAIRNFGKKSLTELMEKLRDRGLVSPKQLETEGGGDAGTNPVA